MLIENIELQIVRLPHKSSDPGLMLTSDATYVEFARPSVWPRGFPLWDTVDQIDHAVPSINYLV